MKQVINLVFLVLQFLFAAWALILILENRMTLVHIAAFIITGGVIQSLLRFGKLPMKKKEWQGA